MSIFALYCDQCDKRAEHPYSSVQHRVLKDQTGEISHYGFFATICGCGNQIDIHFAVSSSGEYRGGDFVSKGAMCFAHLPPVMC